MKRQLMRRAPASAPASAFEAIKSGSSVELQCYHYDCLDIKLGGILGEEHFVNPAFRGSERFLWAPDKQVKAFKLTKQITCPRCGTVFQIVIVVDKFPGKPPIIFGREEDSF